jgi:hypothetical protein
LVEKRRVAAHQVNFLPWPGFWHKLISADVFVVCGGFKFSRRSFENRVRMEDTGDWATVPVSLKGPLSQDIKISDPEAVVQIARRIAHWSSQRRYRHRARIAPVIECLRDNSETRLYRMNLQLIEVVRDILGHHKTKICTDMADRTNQPVEESISEIVSHHGNVYLSGSSGPSYADGSKVDGIDELYVQELQVGVPKYSVLHMIAELDEPLAEIQQMGDWRKW